MESIKQFRAKCRKNLTPKQWKERPWFTEKITRRISIYLTWIFVQLGFTANQVSLLVFILGALSGIAFIKSYFLLAVLVLQIWYLVDAVDGEIARYHKVDDLTGDYSDKLMHYVIEAWIFYSIGIGLSKKFDAPWIQYVGFWTTFFFTLLKLIYDLKYKCFMTRAQIFQGEIYFRKKKIREHHQPGSRWRQRILKTYSLYPNVMNIITLCVLVDSFWVGFQWMEIRWTALLILIISYSLFYPSACFKGYYAILKHRGIDKEFGELLISSDLYRDSDTHTH